MNGRGSTLNGTPRCGRGIYGFDPHPAPACECNARAASSESECRAAPAMPALGRWRTGVLSGRHLHAHTCIYMHIHAHTLKYLQILAYIVCMCMYVQVLRVCVGMSVFVGIACM